MNTHRLIGPVVLIIVAALSGFSQITGKVVGVTDGDTLTVLDTDKRQHKIRLAGINRAETCRDINQKAKRHMSGLVFGKTIRIEGIRIDNDGRRFVKFCSIEKT